MLALLDVRTLIVACAIVFAGITLALTFVWRQTLSMAGLGRLALAHGLTVLGAVLVGWSSGAGFFSSVAGNTVLVAAAALLSEGTRRFFGLGSQRRLTLVVVPAAAVLFATLLYVRPNEQARTLAYSGLVAVFFGRAAWTTLRQGRRQHDGASALVMAAALATECAALASRGVFTLAAPHGAGRSLAALTLVVTLSAAIGWTIGLVTTINRRLMRAVSASKDLFEKLVVVARATSEGPSLKLALHGALAVANKLTGAEASSLLLADETGHITRAFQTRGASAAVVSPSVSDQVMRDGLAGWVARRREAALVADTAADQRWIRVTAEDWVTRSALAVPISSGDALVGVLTLIHSAPGHFTDEHRRLMETAAAQIALTLRNAQISDTRLRLATRQTLLYEVLRASSWPLDPNEIAEAAADAIALRTRWTHVVVALPGTSGMWRLHGRSVALYIPNLPLAGGVIGRAFRTGRTQVLPDVSRDPDYVSGAEAIRSELAVPLRAGERVLGVLNLESDIPDAFGSDEIQLAESLAEAISLGLENARLYRETSEQSARLTAVLESSRDGLVLVGREGRLLLVNVPGLCRLGVTGAPADWIGQHVDRLVETLAAEAPEVAAVVRGLGASRDATPSGGEWSIGSSVFEWLDLPVPAVGRLLVLRDVTQVRQAEHLRETLTDMMVHDLRSPLSGVLGALEMLAGAVEGHPHGARLVHVARANAQRQLRLIDAILDVSRLEQRSVPLERRRVALADVVTEVLRLAAPSAAGKDVELRAETAPDVPEVYVDRDIIARVIDNLVANAVKFSPSGGHVRVSVAPHAPAGARVAVTDAGPGVSPELLPRLFQKFAPGGHRGHGSGLGLAFCRMAVEAHGGRIWLEPPSDSGGSTFTFTLPDAPVRA